MIDFVKIFLYFLGMAKSSSQSPRTRQVILQLLKQHGPLDSQDLATHLGVSAMAVRQHLYALQDEQLITYEEESRSKGRPAKLWRLTAAADRFFPQGYADLSVGLIQSIKDAFGEQGMEQILAVRTRHQIDHYQAQIPENAPLQKRVEALAHLRTTEGYMAQAQLTEDNAILLIENHCPICTAAAACTGLCAQELEVFQAVLGAEAVIERTEHIIAGARRCAYRIGSPPQS